ncbi:MAG TPA: hypothetical protein VGB37_06250 [Candidatus Lokiarchaeia archaeon]
MAKKKDICDNCKTKKNLFLLESEIGYNFFCNLCLIPILKEKPETIVKIWRLDNKYYELIEKEVKQE